MNYIHHLNTFLWLPDSVPDLGPNNKLSSNNESRECEAHSPDFSVSDLSGENSNWATPHAAATPPTPSIPPPKEEVLHYFTTIKYSEKEALRFYAHYQANGWLLGGKVPIRNWQAAADKWVSNSFENKQFNDHKINQNGRTKSDQLLGQHNVNQNKSYDKPF